MKSLFLISILYFLSGCSINRLKDNYRDHYRETPKKLIAPLPPEAPIIESPTQIIEAPVVKKGHIFGK